MSVFGKIFGHKNKEKPPTISDAIQKLRDTEENLLKKQTYLEEKIAKEIKSAKDNAKRNRKVALAALQRKKRYEQELQKIDGVLSTVEVQLATLDSANTNTAVLSSMKDADAALKATHKIMNVDQVDEMLGNLADQREMTGEITDAISRPVAWDDDLDEDELAKELEELGMSDEDLDEKLPNVPEEQISTKIKEKNKKKDKIASLAS